MNFKKITDDLLDRIDHKELADALGVSVASIRQARLSPNAHAYRQPPAGWEGAVLDLARKRLAHYQRLVVQMEKVVSAAAH